jgi:hypothetical protein
MSLAGSFKMASGLAQQPFQQEQEAITGSQAEEHIADGVHWKLETTAFGSVPISRWSSPDFKWDGNFLYLTQKMQGQGSQGGLMSMLGKTLFKASLSLYGFSLDLTPGLDSARAFASLDAGLEPHFFAYTSDETGARQILNSWAVSPLSAWAQSHPLTKGNTDQLAVLFSPQGVFVAMAGLVNQEFLDEVAKLGAELVKAQGGTR